MTNIQQVSVDRLVSVAQYAKERGVTRQTVYNWIATGEAKVHKIGKAFFVVRP